LATIVKTVADALTNVNTANPTLSAANAATLQQTKDTLEKSLQAALNALNVGS